MTFTVPASTSVGHADGWSNIQGEFWRAGPVAPDFKHAAVTPRFAAEAVEVSEMFEQVNTEALIPAVGVTSPPEPPDLAASLTWDPMHFAPVE